ncbi:MAG TPA: PQQ-dependent sugar dehydrogenase [Nitrososphaera sp.]|nr:PQQ-dependent sugar dehydrogenase [Nitrososphaera sp.]
MPHPILSISLALILLFALGHNFAVGQEAEITGLRPSVNDTSLTVERVAGGLISPTTMTFLDEDTILVLEKDNGTVRVIEDGELQPEPLLDVAVANDGERGMLGTAVLRENDTTTYVFLYFTESGGGVDGDDTQGVPPAGNRLYRYELEGNQLVNPTLLLNLPALPGPRYNGGPVLIGPDNNVYVIIGDVGGHTTMVQNFENGPGPDGTSGILRVGKNGEAPESIIGSDAFAKYYFAYGMRSSHGMDFDPMTGVLWNTENGAPFVDEINLVNAGFNSGWKIVQGMVPPDYNLTDLVMFNEESHYSNPEFTWTEPVNPTALEFLNSSALGQQYENNVFVGDTSNGTIYRFQLNENRSAFVLEGALDDTVANTPEEAVNAIFGTGFGGITDIKTGPDGYLYILSFVDGTLFRVVPAAEVLRPNAIVAAGGTADLTVRAADLSGDTITGVYIVIEATNGTTLMEGHAPLTFTGTAGSTYSVTVPVLGNMEFDRWDNGVTDRTRSVNLDQGDTTITAYLDVESTSANATIDTRTIIIQRFADVVDQDNCFDAEDAGRLYMVIGNVMRNMFSEREGGSNQLQQEIDRLVVQGCPIVDVSPNEPNPGNPSDTTEPSESNSEEGGGGAAAADEEEEDAAAADEEEEDDAADDEEGDEEEGGAEEEE